jgi:hypothetical protein
VDDTIAESTESVILTLSASTLYHLDPIAANRTATVNIADNEPVISIAASAPNASEPDVSGAFTISRVGPTTLPVTVYFTRGGTAAAATDYVNFVTYVTIPAGASSVDVAVQPLADTLVEAPETVILTLSANSAYNLAALPANRTATVSIADGVKNASADLVLLSLAYVGKTYSLSALTGQTLALSGQVRNQGLAATGPFNVTFVLSQDRVLGNADDVSLGSAAVAGATAGQTVSYSRTVAMPSLTGLTIGQYFVFAEIGLPDGNTFVSPLANLVIAA